MTGLWSLASSAQLFTQNLHTQHAAPKRARRANKAGSGAGNMPAPWLQCVSLCMCAEHHFFCPPLLFLYEKFILNHPSLISSVRSHSFSVCTDCLLCLTCCTNICDESSRECVCVYVCYIFSNCELTTEAESTACKKPPPQNVQPH